MPVVLACIVSSGLLGAAAIWALRRILLDDGDRAGFGDSGLDLRTVLVLGVVAPLLALVRQPRRPAVAGPPAALRRHDRRVDVRGRLRCGIRRRRDADGAPPTCSASRRCAAATPSCGCRSSPTPRSSSRSCTAPPWRSPPPGSRASAPATKASAGASPRALAIAADGMVAYGAGVALLGEPTSTASRRGPRPGLGGRRRRRLDRRAAHATAPRGPRGSARVGRRTSPTATRCAGGAQCGECEMPLAPLALFCSACGTSVRATSKPRQRHNAGRTVAASVPRCRTMTARRRPGARMDARVALSPSPSLP